MELQKEPKTCFLTDEQFISLMLCILKDDPISPNIQWNKFYYNEITFELILDPEEGIMIQII